MKPMLLPLLALFVAFATKCLKETNGAVVVRSRSLSEEDTQRIKKDHILKDDAQLELEFLSSENPTINAGGRIIELDAALEEYSVLSSHCKISVDGKGVDTPPKSKLYAGSVNGTSFFLAKNNRNHAEFLHVHDGFSERSLHAVGNKEGEMVVIKPEDYDVEKMNQMFKYGDSGEDGGGDTTWGAHQVKMDPSINYDAMVEPRDQPDTDASDDDDCESFREIEIAIVFDSAFCKTYKGADGAVSRVHTVVGLSSQRYQQKGLCTKLIISDIEGYCDPSADLQFEEVYGSNDDLLNNFRLWMNQNRPGTRRHVAHLFTGSDFSVDRVIGKAYLNAMCNNKAYGINFITFSVSETAQAMLLSHELGHNSGAVHFGDRDPSYIMNQYLGSGQNGFSDVSINSMNQYLNTQPCYKLSKNSSRRRLQSTASKSFRPGDETYQKYLEACGDFEYPLFLHVDKHSHLMVYGVPPEPAVAAGCPFGAAHSVFLTRQGKPVAEKEILMWSNADEGMAMFKEEESLPIGTFQLADLARAYEATPDDDSIGNHGVYDIVTNNCATFMVKMASTLGVKIDGRITSFVARRLLEESGTELANKIRNSMHYFSLLFGDRRHRNLRSSVGEATVKPQDQELIEALVNKGASGMLFTG